MTVERPEAEVRSSKAFISLQQHQCFGGIMDARTPISRAPIRKQNSTPSKMEENRMFRASYFGLESLLLLVCLTASLLILPIILPPLPPPPFMLLLLPICILAVLLILAFHLPMSEI